MPVKHSVVLKKDTYFPKRKIPKILSIFFLFYQALGYDFGFALVLRKKYRSIVQITTLLISIFTTAVLFVYIAFRYNDIWFLFNVTKHNIFILVLIITRYKLCHLICDINRICDLSSKQIKIINIITISYIFLIYVTKLAMLTIRCNLEENSYCLTFPSIFYYVFYVVIIISLDIIGQAQTTVMYYIKCSINIIKTLLKKPDRNLELYEKSYKAIADCYDKIRPLYDGMIIVQVGINVPKLMATLWDFMLYVKNNGKWYSYMGEFTFALELIIQICIPAITVQLLNSEMDSTTQLLNQEIMDAKDDREIGELKRILRYIRNRPLRHLVWQFIPTDLRLLLTLFSLCTSYFIVVLQFSQTFS